MPPRAVREFEGMPLGCAVEAACEAVVEAIDDDEFLGRAVGGVGDARLSMAGFIACSRGLAVSLAHFLTSRCSSDGGETVHLLTCDSLPL